MGPGVHGYDTFLPLCWHNLTASLYLNITCKREDKEEPTTTQPDVGIAHVTQRRQVVKVVNKKNSPNKNENPQGNQRGHHPWSASE